MFSAWVLTPIRSAKTDHPAFLDVFLWVNFMNTDHGNEVGSICNRNGCKGTIVEASEDRSCYCHISPPCSVCADDRHYCTDCDWNAADEQHASYISANESYKSIFVWKSKQERLAEMDHSKIEWISESHSNSSMKKIGKCPLDAKSSEVFEVVKGTFGGRFESFVNGHFTFIAYTD